MELFAPDQIVLDSVSSALMGDVAETARRVHEYRPLPPAVVQRIEDRLLGERVYSSNAIEGNTLTLRETVAVLKHGIGSVSRRREAIEAQNLGQAVQKVGEWVSSAEDLFTIDRVLESHRVVLQGLSESQAGIFRNEGGMITGARYQPPDAGQVRPLLERVLRVLEADATSDPVLLGSWTHLAIARIHPFFDGNGRVARLWQDLILLKRGLTCAIIRPEDRRSYYDALSEADEGRLDPLVQLVASRILNTFDVYLQAVRDEREARAWAQELAGDVDARVEERRRLSYMRWQRRMEQVRWEFEQVAAQLSEYSKEIKVQLVPKDLLDQTAWENLRSGQSVGATNFFRLDFVRGSRRRRYHFFFGRHFWVDEFDTERDRAERRVNLLASEDDGRGEAKRLGDGIETPTLRELFVVDDELVRRRFDPATGQDTYDRGIEPAQVAREFIEEVVRHRLV